ncbi:MAG: HlyD family efflux transporter periplasmic adaptor subunit [Chloroflexi bacterium]|nr:HlyD family efflux transporter periplasmic adaptor subunit [Chloroflexota bacterium]
MTENTKKLTRRLLLTLGPALVILVAGWFYVTGGRYIGTENAYIKTDIISVVPEVSGRIVDVDIAENKPVQKGDVLFKIDPAPYRIAVQKAQADLIAAKAQIEAQKSRYLQKQEDIAIAQSDYDLAKKTYERRAALKKQNSAVISPEEMDNATHAIDSTKKRVALLQQQQNEILVMLEGNPDIAAEDHPLYQGAQAALDKAKLNLDYTVVKSPANGTIRHAPHVGDFAQMGLPATNLAVSEKTWIEANYKETELTNVVPGQKVDITVDTYPDYAWQGTVESISPATESEFSILPAQNATGNWVKVVQRIPVRISVEQSPDGPALRAGMSTEVTIDTGVWPHMPEILRPLFP